jgi:alkylhydroperoxidase/carboxymuconolactone decarboxylase family protein YurZ
MSDQSQQGSIAFLREHGGVIGEAVGGLVDATYSPSVLEPKTRELVYLGVLSAVGLKMGIVAHIERALRAGCTQEDIVDAIMIGTVNGGVNGALQALPAALDEIESASARIASTK